MHICVYCGGAICPVSSLIYSTALDFNPRDPDSFHTCHGSWYKLFFPSVVILLLAWTEYQSMKPEYIPYFAEIKVHPEISAHQKQWFFKGGSTQNRWVFYEWFFKGGGGVHKTDGFWWVLEFFLLLIKIKRPGRLFRQIWITEYRLLFLMKLHFSYTCCIMQDWASCFAFTELKYYTDVKRRQL